MLKGHQLIWSVLCPQRRGCVRHFPDTWDTSRLSLGTCTSRTLSCLSPKTSTSETLHVRPQRQDTWDTPVSPQSNVRHFPPVLRDEDAWDTFLRVLCPHKLSYIINTVKLSEEETRLVDEESGAWDGTESPVTGSRSGRNIGPAAGTRSSSYRCGSRRSARCSARESRCSSGGARARPRDSAVHGAPAGSDRTTLREAEPVINICDRWSKANKNMCS